MAKKISLIVMFTLIITTLCFGAEEYLIRVELTKDRLTPFIEKGLKVVSELDNCAILLVESSDFYKISPYSYHVLDEEPQEGDYYLVHPLNSQIDLTKFGELLTSDGENFLIKIKEGILEELIKQKVMISRLSLKPILIKDEVSPLRFRANPIVQVIVNRVEPDSVLRFVRRLQDFRTRFSTHDSCFAAANYIANKFNTYGCDSIFFQYHTSGHAPNVIGVKRGVLYPDSIYTVICGHFDAVSDQAPDIAPGADDNASGTVATIEAARVMKDFGFEYSVRYIAFSGEEFGLYGSDYYASLARSQGDSILGVLNGDMIAYVDALPESIEVIAKISNPPCEPLADFFIACADTYTTLLTRKRMVFSAPYSDHAPFWYNGYFALCNIEDSPVVNPHYHLTSDTVGAGYNNNAFATEVIKAEIAALSVMAKPFMNTFLTVLSNWIDDPAPGGNGNGMWESGEEVGLVVQIYNAGFNTAENSNASISTSDPYVTIINGSSNLGDILPLDTVEASLIVKADNSTPLGHLVDFDLNLTCIGGTWDYPLQVYINPLPTLTYQHSAIVGGNGNGILDPDETADLIITLKNEGARDAENVTSTLQSLSSYVTINDSSGNFGTIAVGDTANNALDPFTVTADIYTPSGTTAGLRMIVESGLYTDTLSFQLVIGKKQYYIWNPDPTPTPGENCHTLLSNLGYIGDYGTSLTQDLSLYRAVFVCVGIFPNNYVIDNNSPEAARLVDFLENQDGRMYLEGGEVWYYDPLFNDGYDFGPLFDINPTDPGYDELVTILGQSGTFTQGMSFSYSGENNFIDHISPQGTGFLIFCNSSPPYDCGVASDAGTYQTVGTSFELGLLNDGTPPSTRVVLLDSIMNFFGIPKPGVEEEIRYPGLPLKTRLASLYPNPFYDKLVIRYQIENNAKDIELKIYNVAGRHVKEFSLPTPYSLLPTSLIWDGKDGFGHPVSAGIYFVHFKAGDYRKIRKAILIK